MKQDPDVIREDIEETRARMGETVEALAYKTDISSRTRDAVNDRVEAIKGNVSNAVSSATSAVGAAGSAVRDATANAKESVASVASLASSNPLGLAIGSIAAGFLIGLCLPVTAIERDRVGRIGEQMTEHAKSVAANAVQQGKAAVTSAVGDAISATAQNQA